MTIKELIVNIPVKEIKGNVDQEVTSIHFDSRKVEPGSVFVAVKGRATDGHKFIDIAIDRGALCVVREREEGEKGAREQGKSCFIEVEDSASALALMSSKFFGEPSKQLTMVGVTGTNGKTTVATLLYNLFSELGYKCGLLSTIENKIGDQVVIFGSTIFNYTY